MAEYITRNNAISAVCFGCNQEFSNEPCEPDACAIRKSIMALPSADVVELKHGEWEKDIDKIREDGEIYDYRCSVCKGEAHKGEYHNNDEFSDFCHHCGAKMDGERK